MSTTIIRSYIPVPGSSLKQGDVDVIAPELERHFDEKGWITPEIFVKAARPKRSPLHPYIEWDDARAAEAHRLDQAAKILRSIVVVETNGEERRTRAYERVMVSEGEEQQIAYVPAETVFRNATFQAQVIRAIQLRIAHDARRLREFEDWTGTEHAADLLDQAVDALGNEGVATAA